LDDLLFFLIRNAQKEQEAQQCQNGYCFCTWSIYFSTKSDDFFLDVPFKILYAKYPTDFVLLQNYKSGIGPSKEHSHNAKNCKR